MPGIECTKLTYVNYNEYIDNLKGFFYCDIETPENAYLVLLPVRNNTGIQFPLGKFDCWYYLNINH